jgi:phytoene synthase
MRVPDSGAAPGASAELSVAASLVRRHDPDRFLTAILAPPDRRERLMLLYAFNHELARAREVASVPTLALIRLQWWREVVEGARRRHELAEPLGAALDAGMLSRPDLLAMIDGRELEAEEGMPLTDDFWDYLRHTAGAAAAAAARALGGEGPVVARIAGLGTAYGIAGQVRSIAVLASQGRCMLPQDVLAEHGLTPDEVIARPDDLRLRPVVATLAGWGGRLLAEHGGRLPRSLVAAALPAVLARRDFARRPAQPVPRGLGDRLAVLWGAARARV